MKEHNGCGPLRPDRNYGEQRYDSGRPPIARIRRRTLAAGVTMSFRPILATVLAALAFSAEVSAKPTTLALSPTTSPTRLW